MDISKYNKFVVELFAVSAGIGLLKNNRNLSNQDKIDLSILQSRKEEIQKEIDKILSDRDSDKSKIDNISYNTSEDKKTEIKELIKAVVNISYELGLYSAISENRDITRSELEHNAELKKQLKKIEDKINNILDTL